MREYGLIEQKDDHCYTHKSDYINECHRSISGNIIWVGCPKCKEEMQILKDKAAQQKDYQLRLEQIKQSESVQQPTVKKLKGF